MRLIQWGGGEFEFSEGVTIPPHSGPKRKGPPGRYSFPFAALSLGESFTIEPDRWDGPSGFDPEYCVNRLSKAASAYRKRRWEKGHNVNFRTAQIMAGNRKVAIVQRVEPTPYSDKMARARWGRLNEAA